MATHPDIFFFPHFPSLHFLQKPLNYYFCTGYYNLNYYL
jgi:hypothetical protein